MKKREEREKDTIEKAALGFARLLRMGKREEIVQAGEEMAGEGRGEDKELSSKKPSRLPSKDEKRRCWKKPFKEKGIQDGLRWVRLSAIMGLSCIRSRLKALTECFP